MVVTDSEPEQAARPLDRFLNEATHQFEEGHVDQPLWVRALEQAGGDKDQATESYLRSRATALKVIDRELRSRQQAQSTAQGPVAAAPSAVRIEPPVVARRPQRGRKQHPWRLYAAAAGTTVVVAVVGVFTLDAYRQGDMSTATTSAVALLPKPAHVLLRTPAPDAAPVAPVAEPGSASKEFLAKVQSLRDAGNWNVLVLYAAEWTRKEPGNARAWNELSLGYANLRQYADARDAVRTALKLSPDDARYWRSLAQLDLDLDEPVEALRAFGSAAALDDKDTYSLVQSGVLNMQLGRLAEARVAFDRALVLRPDDADALCLKGVLASRAVAPKSAGSANQPVMGKCRDGADAQRVAAAAGDVQKPAPASRR